MTKSVSWSSARTLCKDIRANYDLAVIEEEIENDFLMSQIDLKFDNTPSFWIGLKKIGDDLIWVDSNQYWLPENVKELLQTSSDTVRPLIFIVFGTFRVIDTI